MFSMKFTIQAKEKHGKGNKKKQEEKTHKADGKEQKIQRIINYDFINYNHRSYLLGDGLCYSINFDDQIFNRNICN